MRAVHTIFNGVSINTEHDQVHHEQDGVHGLTDTESADTLDSVTLDNGAQAVRRSERILHPYLTGESPVDYLEHAVIVQS
jgi:hypothetical protein